MEFQRWLALHILNIHFQSQLLNYKADLKDVYSSVFAFGKRFTLPGTIFEKWSNIHEKLT